MIDYRANPIEGDGHNGVSVDLDDEGVFSSVCSSFGAFEGGRDLAISDHNAKVENQKKFNGLKDVIQVEI